MSGLLFLLVAAQLVFGLWILFRAFQVSVGWGFFFLIGGALIYSLVSRTMGEIVASVIVLGMIGIFAKDHWREVKVPVVGIATTSLIGFLIQTAVA